MEIIFLIEKWQKKKKDKCCTQIQEESSDGWKDSEGQSNHTPRRCWASLEHPPQWETRVSASMEGMSPSARGGGRTAGLSAAWWGPETDSEKARVCSRFIRPSVGKWWLRKSLLWTRLGQRVKAIKHPSEWWGLTCGHHRCKGAPCNRYAEEEGLSANSFNTQKSGGEGGRGAAKRGS